MYLTSFPKRGHWIFTFLIFAFCLYPGLGNPIPPLANFHHTAHWSIPQSTKVLDLTIVVGCLGTLIALRPKSKKSGSMSRLKDGLGQVFRGARSFVSSTYGMMGLMVISEIFSLLHHGFMPGTIAWMAISILGCSVLQFFETKRLLSEGVCENGTFADSSLNFFLRKFSQKTRSLYTLVLVGAAFLSCVIFQSEQVTNLLEAFSISCGWITALGPALVFPLILILYKSKFSGLSKLSSRFLFIPFLALALGSLMILVINYESVVNILYLIAGDFFNPKSILGGIIAGLVANLSRSLYRTRVDSDDLALYHTENQGNHWKFCCAEGLFMSGLTLVAGLIYLIPQVFAAHFLQMVPLVALAFMGFFIIAIESAYCAEILEKALPRTYAKAAFMILLILGLALGCDHNLAALSECMDFVSVAFLILNFSAFFLSGFFASRAQRVTALRPVEGFT